jgi:hypothetical protein
MLFISEGFGAAPRVENPLSFAITFSHAERSQFNSITAFGRKTIVDVIEISHKFKSRGEWSFSTSNLVRMSRSLRAVRHDLTEKGDLSGRLLPSQSPTHSRGKSLHDPDCAFIACHSTNCFKDLSR